MYGIEPREWVTEVYLKEDKADKKKTNFEKVRLSVWRGVLVNDNMLEYPNYNENPKVKEYYRTRSAELAEIAAREEETKRD
jgi:hypothetical protein